MPVAEIEVATESNSIKVLLTLQILYFFFSLDYDFKLSTLSRNFI